MHAPVFLLLLLPALAALPLARRGGRIRAALAGAALLSLVLALARPVVRIPRRAGTVVVVADRSASLPPAERDAQKALLDAVAARRAGGEKLGVVSFGETAAVRWMYDLFMRETDGAVADMPASAFGQLAKAWQAARAVDAGK